MKRTFAIIFAIILLAISTLPAYANSAPTDWYGSDSMGAVALDKNCPIEVTKEILTLDITDFPRDDYENKAEIDAYSSKVTAEYTFYNPTDTEVTATLAFPFGTSASYLSWYDEETEKFEFYRDTEKYDITVNGDKISKTVRYTFDNGFEFDLEKSMSRLRDGYTEHNFYSPDMTVTKYTYKLDGINELKHSDVGHDVGVAFDWNYGDGETRLAFSDCQNKFELDYRNVRCVSWAEGGKEIEIYAIGKPLTTLPEWKFYKYCTADDSERIEKPNGVSIELISTDTMTFEDFALKAWSEEYGVSKTDWYNAVVDSFDESELKQYAFIDKYLGDYAYFSDSNEYDYMSCFMRWYEYEITVPAKSSVVNTVTAPIYPAIDMSYKPNVYSYTYLLSPASKWASFGEIEININTPFYITDSRIKGFAKTENGYTYKKNSLPNGELEFSLCEKENPTEVNYFFQLVLYVIVFFAPVLIPIAIAVVIIVIVCIVLLVMMKKNKK